MRCTTRISSPIITTAQCRILKVASRAQPTPECGGAPGIRNIGRSRKIRRSFVERFEYGFPLPRIVNSAVRRKAARAPTHSAAAAARTLRDGRPFVRPTWRFQIVRGTLASWITPPTVRRIRRLQLPRERQAKPQAGRIPSCSSTPPAPRTPEALRTPSSVTSTLQRGVISILPLH
jgi:hypothetical protein